MEQTKKDSRLLWSTALVFLISGICTPLMGNFIPFVRDAYGLDYEFSGLLLSATSVGGFIAIVLSSVLPLYIGRRRSALFWSAWLVIGYALLSSSISIPWVLFIAFTGVGLSRGGTTNFVGTITSTLPPNKAIRAFLIIHSSFAVGALLAPLLLVYLVSKGFSWKFMINILFVVAILLFVLYAKMDIPLLPRDQRGISSVDYSFLKSRYFWLTAIILFFYVSVEYGIVGWLVTYFQDAGILSSEMSQLMNSLFWLFVLIGRVSGSFISNKIAPLKLLAIDVIGMTIFFFIMFFSTSAISVIIGLMGVSLFMATVYPTAYGFGSSYMRGNDVGCSMLNFMPSFGGVITPALVGFVAEKGGIQKGMELLIVLTIVLLVIVLCTAFIMREVKE